MLRTIFSIGIFALLGMFALKLLFGVLGFALGVLTFFLVIGVKIAIVAALGYIALRIVAPETARKLTSRSN